MTSRTVAASHPAYRDDIADLITRRPLPGADLEQVDPFLFLNHHGPQVYAPNNNGLPFGPHPHRGFETVTFILTGNLAHYDTGGHESVIEAGGVQWMTAGSGLIHAEVSPPGFKHSGGALEILQLWVNLPSRLKMTAPRYSGVQADGIPALSIADGKGVLNLVSGEFQGTQGAIQSLTGVFMSTVQLQPGAQVQLPAPLGRSVFLYVVSGQVSVGGTAVKPWHLISINDDGDALGIEAASDAVLLFGHADPINEPVVSHGPFVMNTHGEIEQAIRDYQAGKFNGDGKLLEVGE
ncbi:Pirin-like protein [Pseudomonas sp. M47T1]|uniref:pirin family protein n=1 Tax=Pseudomonas sp. M47T1 TaxID=1179778 RepID=UPI000260727D|nr:pirin family protein [Pseudomonas sp. M47T1]EIK96134.1 Pirin-like protein [Pseudomonas sp. M47T1]